MRYCIATLSLLLVTGCGNGNQAGNATSADFESVRDLVCRGKYAEAVPKLKAYRGQHESRAGLFLGKAYLATGNFEEAKAAFEQTIKKFPKSLEAHKSKYKLGILTQLMGERDKARSQFQAIVDDKDGPLVAEATAFVRYLK